MYNKVDVSFIILMRNSDDQLTSNFDIFVEIHQVIILVFDTKLIPKMPSGFKTNLVWHKRAFKTNLVWHKRARLFFTPDVVVKMR